MECILEQNWPEAQRTIIRWYFSTYILYVICAVVYMKLALATGKDEDEDEPSVGMIFLFAFTLLFWLRQV